MRSLGTMIAVGFEPTRPIGHCGSPFAEIIYALGLWRSLYELRTSCWIFLTIFVVVSTINEKNGPDLPVIVGFTTKKHALAIVYELVSSAPPPPPAYTRGVSSRGGYSQPEASARLQIDRV